MLVLLSAGSLLIGIASERSVGVALALVASAAALVLLWAGVTRTSGPSKRHRHG